MASIGTGVCASEVAMGSTVNADPNYLVHYAIESAIIYELKSLGSSHLHPQLLPDSITDFILDC